MQAVQRQGVRVSLKNSFLLSDDEKLEQGVKQCWADGHARILNKLASELSRDSVLNGKDRPIMLPMELKILSSYGLLRDDGEIPKKLVHILLHKDFLSQ